MFLVNIISTGYAAFFNYSYTTFELNVRKFKSTDMRKFNNQTPFCIVNKKDSLVCVTGKIAYLDRIDQLNEIKSDLKIDNVSMVPYKQIKENNDFYAHDNGEKIITLVTETYDEFNKIEFINSIDNVVLKFKGTLTNNIDDLTFEEIIIKIISEEIKNGEGSNFLISRKTLGLIENFDVEATLGILSRFIKNEPNAYMHFLFFDGNRYFVGASPEMHISIEKGKVITNPICGTLPKFQEENFKSSLMNFLRDKKEINELFQVLDETMKIMVKVCQDGGVIKGPYLKEMGTLIHTCYELEGNSTLNHLTIFSKSMFAPTMIGSPLANASRIIYKYETESRRYYSSAILIRGKDQDGEYCLDSSITIRTIEIDLVGNFILQAGASIVQDSIASKERVEVNSKGLGCLNSISKLTEPDYILDDIVDESVNDLLYERNNSLSTFWLRNFDINNYNSEKISAKSVLVIDNNDDFSYMIAHILRRLGFQIRVENSSNIPIDINLITEDLVILGPGPGNPKDLMNARIAHITKIGELLLQSTKPFIGVCLGHQIITILLGCKLVKLDNPLQGSQADIDFFGTMETVGFYNTFVTVLQSEVTRKLDISKNLKGHLYATRSENFSTFQFHVESVLTTNGAHLIFNEIKRLVCDL